VVGAVLLAAFAVDVPAWTLALAIALVPVAMVVFALAGQRRLGHLEGELATERELREVAERKLSALSLDSPSEDSNTNSVQESLLFRLKALRGELERRDSFYPNSSQIHAIRNLAAEIRDLIGKNLALESIIDAWATDVDQHRGVDDGITALGQLEGMVIRLSTHAALN
jgi:hypothetical protein